ncbi:cytochrome C [Ancylomarina salipaludis]|uniref:Cytochrome C n=1 Tax=Ancylomarina salipaludis TaxID=2501299 RepID=A0A4Q1JNP0_9BACT|nr:NapC/NirT family cytochrome c [Ancylomarina salipaludis]RXQ96479.1 cytochrome C [Ancylomarina salipaludis]
MKLPNSARNWLSLLGAGIAAMNLFIIGFLLALSFFYNLGSSYLGLFIYIILPMFFVGGLILIPIGMIRTNRKLKKHLLPEDQLKWPQVDFNDQKTRNASMIFIFGTIFIMIISSVGSYHAFHYTESVEFCGKLCHQVMAPEFTAYHQSSHERVKCVECHVGEGTSWYVRSKLSGLYQVYSVIAKKYPKPIPTPVENLRPARETCEQCHWPQKFYDSKLKNKKSYLADETTTENNISMKMKTSANLSAKGISEGIHWHINPDVKIEYIASSRNRETLPWVKYTNLTTGKVKLYIEPENQLSQKEIDSLETRTMDCLDCHNRPSHDYQNPQNFIDELISSGEISKELPDAKVMSMDILNQDYPTTDSAMIAIKAQVLEYYGLMYPEVLDSCKTKIEKAITAIQNGYKSNIFPEMGVTWKAYPNHLGHLETNGCFRCHNDKHVTAEGEKISRDCNLCHDIISQGKTGEMEMSTLQTPLEFKHPINIDEQWKTQLCSECHAQLY